MDDGPSLPCFVQAEETMRERVKKASTDLGNVNTLALEV